MMLVNHTEQPCRRGKNCANVPFVTVSREDTDSGGGSEMAPCTWPVPGMRCSPAFTCRPSGDLSLRVTHKGLRFQRRVSEARLASPWRSPWYLSRECRFPVADGLGSCHSHWCRKLFEASPTLGLEVSVAASLQAPGWPISPKLAVWPLIPSAQRHASPLLWPETKLSLRWGCDLQSKKNSPPPTPRNDRSVFLFLGRPRFPREVSFLHLDSPPAPPFQ